MILTVDVWNLQQLSHVIGHDIGGKYITIMARLAKARRWSKQRQVPNLTATHNE
jgi:hypothetical protein